MPKSHRASIFRNQIYLDQMSELVAQVDQANVEPLRSRVVAVIDRLRPAWPVISSDFSINSDSVITTGSELKWPLSVHHAGSLPNSDWALQNKSPGNSDLGQWFLICLAEYISPCPSAVEGNWKIMYDVLYRIGWSQTECDLLFKGRPTSFLLKPAIGQESPWPIKESDPYWLWLQPIRARAGWMKFSDALDFYSRLELMEKQILGFNLRKLFNISVDNSGFLIEQRNYLAAGYSSTIEMLKSAIVARQGLFMSISLI